MRIAINFIMSKVTFISSLNSIEYKRTHFRHISNAYYSPINFEFIFFIYDFIKRKCNK